MTFRYDTSNQWFKGNTHIHSRASDGGKSFGELAEMYASVGYDFLFRTDHWVASDTAQDTDAYPLLWLDGAELQMTTSPIRFLRLVGPGSRGNRLGSFDGPLLTSASLPIPQDWSYAYVEIEDETGRRAWTNNLFTDQGLLAIDVNEEEGTP